MIEPKLIHQEPNDPPPVDPNAPAGQQAAPVENKPMKITYKIEKEGYYNVVFSNEHSWYHSKTLKYRWCVLMPDDVQKQGFDERKGNEFLPVSET